MQFQLIKNKGNYAISTDKIKGNSAISTDKK